jgi:hypothetical protein
MMPAVPTLTSRAARLGALGGVFAGAAAVSYWLVRPLEGGPAAFDAAASVLFFDRIAAGRQLEAWVNTTPKPLLTLIFGALHAVGHDWRLVSLATVLITALSVVLAAELARRIAGLEAAAFATVAGVGLLSLQVEASWSYGLPWAFALWLAAGLILVRPRPRYGLAGGFLLLAGLVRPETFIFLGVGTLLLGWRAARGPQPPRGAWLLLIGWLAIVGLCVHDLLLTGDPLWWTSVASHSVALNGGRARSVAGVVLMSVQRLGSMIVLVVAGCGGLAVLVRRRSWIALAGLVVMGPLVVVYTWLLALARLNVIGHYLDPVNLAVMLAAAVGTGSLLTQVRRRLAEVFPRTTGRSGQVLSVAAAVTLAVLLSTPFSPTSSSARRSIAHEASLAVQIGTVVPILDGAISRGRPGTSIDPGPMGSPDPTAVLAFVPRLQVPRLAVDLDLPLSRIAGLVPAQVDLARGYPPIGSVVYLDGSVDPATVGPETAVLRVSGPVIVGAVRLVPVVADAAKGLWIVKIETAP